MATPLQLPTTSSIPPLSSSSTYLRRRFTLTLCCTNNRNSANFLVPLVNPKYRNMPLMNTKDLFLPKIASLPENLPEKLLRPSDPDQLSLLDPFHSPIAMAAAPAVVGRSARYKKRVRKKFSPPDDPSTFLEKRVVYIDMPFMPMFTEIVIAQLMYLELKDPDAPITLHILSTGTTMDGETVARETEGFAIYDVLMQLRCEVRTIAFGPVIGGACLLLAAGTKGKRCMLRHAIAMIQQCNVPPTGLMQANAVDILAKEVFTAQDTFVELLAKHTGQSVETITKDIQAPFYLDSVKAKEYGVIDKIIWRRQGSMMKNAPP